MQFPLMTRSHHEEVVSGLKRQIVALAKILYPCGAPEEFQLLLGIDVPQNIAKVPVTELELEPEQTDEQRAIEEMESEHAAAERRLRVIARTRPSQLGMAMAEEKARDLTRRAKAANPAPQIFQQARAEALSK
jgi:hypothetical protein